MGMRDEAAGGVSVEVVMNGISGLTPIIPDDPAHAAGKREFRLNSVA
jgi:hypothetical protein